MSWLNQFLDGWRARSFTEYSLPRATVFVMFVSALSTGASYTVTHGRENALGDALGSGLGILVAGAFFYSFMQVKRWGDARADRWHGREMRVHEEDE